MKKKSKKLKKLKKDKKKEPATKSQDMKEDRMDIRMGYQA